jgi:hypothetical protein
VLDFKKFSKRSYKFIKLELLVLTNGTSHLTPPYNSVRQTIPSGSKMPPS